MASLRTLPLALGLALVACPAAHGRSAFNSSDIEGQGTDILFCDLDGDHLEDVVIVDGLNLSIFYQDRKSGFTRKPQRHWRLDERPSLVWPAKAGKVFSSLLVMTSDGVMELCFTNRAAPPSREQIIEQLTIVPRTNDEPRAIYFPLSARTTNDWPLLLVPTAGGLQVWEHRDAWRQSQLLEHAVDTSVTPSVANPGYTRWFGLDLSLGDLNGDGRDDLMLAREAAGNQIYDLYLQKSDGRFAADPALTFTNKDGRATLNWVDLNRDGRPDLIKSADADEPFFVPGMRSGKVLVGIYPADERGQIPAEPRQIFRKNDWSTSLPMADVDGDGYPDLALSYIPLSTREGLRRMITTEQIDLNLKFHFYRPGSGFSREPDFQQDLPIHFRHEFFFWLSQRRYFDLSGDFNGDGKKDFLARDHTDQLSVYFFVSRQQGFNAKADLRFKCPDAIDSWATADLNGDGISDLIVGLENPDAYRIFISQEK